MAFCRLWGRLAAPEQFDPRILRGTDESYKRYQTPYQPQGPHEAAITRAAGNFHTINSWPDDEEEQRQQHSDGHAADVDAVLPVAPPARKSKFRRRDVVTPTTASARWRGGSRRLRTNSQDNLAHWSSSTPSLTNRGRPRWARQDQTRSSARCNRHLLRHKAHCSSERERPSVRDSRRLDAAACVSWVPAERQPWWPAGRSTTRTASFMINGT